MRVKLRLILKSIGRVYPVSKVFSYLLQGIQSKNSKTRAECLEEMASLVQRNGQGVFVAGKAIPLIAHQVGDRDAPCRNAALNALCQIYLVLGEETNKYFSKISEKEKDMIAERIRRLPQKPLVKPVQKAVSAPAPVARKAAPTSAILTSTGNTNHSAANGRKQFTLDFDKIGIVEEDPTDSTISLVTDSRISEASAPFSQRESEVEEEFEQENIEDRLEARLELLFNQLRGADKDSALEATKHLEKLLAAHPNHDVLRCRDVVGDVLQTLMGIFPDLTSNDLVHFKICKHLIAFLVLVFSSKESAACVPNESIDACIQNVLFKLVDPDLSNIDPSKTLSRALNMLMVRAIENCEPNITFRSLLSILRDSANEGSSNDGIHKKYVELVMKCLWKITKLIPTFLKAGALHAELLLIDIDGFFAVAPPQYWKQKTVQTGDSQADMPLRTVKTILHELVNELGDVINQYVIVFNDQQTHTLNYIRQMLSNLQKKSGGSATKSLAHKGESTFSAELDSIFAQIADKDQSKSGIQKLYDFQRKYPSILPVVEEKMAKTGSYFQGYIRKSLASLETSQNAKSDKTPGTPKGTFFF
jgi:cytoskeleton-associated protein 5